MKNSNIEAIVFDLAGTLIDFGSLAPSQVLIELFDRFGIKITRKQAIGPMGIEKRAHIKALLTTRKINSQWKKKFKSKPTDKDIDKLFKLFNPELKKIINKHSKFISGSKKTLDFIKNKKIKIGINTGYSEEILNVILPELKKQRFIPDVSYSSSYTKIGRPSAEGLPIFVYEELYDTSGINLCFFSSGNITFRISSEYPVLIPIFIFLFFIKSKVFLLPDINFECLLIIFFNSGLKSLNNLSISLSVGFDLNFFFHCELIFLVVSNAFIWARFSIPIGPMACFRVILIPNLSNNSIRT